MISTSAKISHKMINRKIMKKDKRIIGGFFMTHKEFYSDLKRIIDITKKVICTVGVYLVITLWLAGLLTTYYYVFMHNQFQSLGEYFETGVNAGSLLMVCFCMTLILYYCAQKLGLIGRTPVFLNKTHVVAAYIMIVMLGFVNFNYSTIVDKGYTQVENLKEKVDIYQKQVKCTHPSAWAGYITPGNSVKDPNKTAIKKGNKWVSKDILSLCKVKDNEYKKICYKCGKTLESGTAVKIKGLGKTYELSNGCIFSYGPYIDSKKMEKCTSHVYGKYRTYMGLKKHIIRKCKLCGHKEEKE